MDATVTLAGDHGMVYVVNVEADGYRTDEELIEMARHTLRSTGKVPDVDELEVVSIIY